MSQAREMITSNQGSVSGNTSGGFEMHRATKSVLNQMFRSYAARHREGRRALLLVPSRGVKTGLGGPTGVLEISDSMLSLVDTIDARHGAPGLRDLDRHGKTPEW